MWILIVLIVILCLFLLALRGRRGHPGLARLRRWSYAHRGLHDETLPENSMGAFRAALEAGYGIELDVHLTADGNLAVIHDSSLQRTAGADVCVGAVPVPPPGKPGENPHLGGGSGAVLRKGTADHRAENQTG